MNMGQQQVQTMAYISVGGQLSNLSLQCVQFLALLPGPGLGSQVDGLQRLGLGTNASQIVIEVGHRRQLHKTPYSLSCPSIATLYTVLCAQRSACGCFPVLSGVFSLPSTL